MKVGRNNLPIDNQRLGFPPWYQHCKELDFRLYNPSSWWSFKKLGYFLSGWIPLLGKAEVNSWGNVKLAAWPLPSQFITPNWFLCFKFSLWICYEVSLFLSHDTSQRVSSYFMNLLDQWVSYSLYLVLLVSISFIGYQINFPKGII